MKVLKLRILSGLFLIIFSQNLFGAILKVKTPCLDNYLLEEEVPIFDNEKISVGQFTTQALSKMGIPYKGTERGINSILNTPTGDQALDVLSNTKMRAFGWCYKVNGIAPEVYPNEVYLDEGDEVEWWYGYALYDQGWKTQCTDSFFVKSSKFCQKLISK